MADPQARALRKTVVVAAGLAVLAAALRLPGLNGAMWLDEVGTLLGFIRLPMSEIVATYSSPNNHVLYSVLGRASIVTFGESAWSVRLPAFVFGFATVPAIYFLTRLWLTERESVWVSLLLAVAYHHIYFSQNARGYTGLLFFAVLSTILLVKAIREGGRRYWVGYAVATALNVYLLLSGLFVAVGQVLGSFLVYVLPAREASERKRRLLSVSVSSGMAAGITLLLYSPMLDQIIHFYTTAEGNVGWLPTQGLLSIIVQTALPAGNPVLLGLGVVCGAPVIPAGLVRIARKAPIVFFVFLFPPLIELGVSLFLGAGSYPRRFFLLMPLAAMVGVSGIHAIAEWASRRTARRAASTGLFVFGLVLGTIALTGGLPRLYRLPMQDFPRALAYVHGQSRSEGLVVAVSNAGPPAQYYDSRVRFAGTVDELEAVLAHAQDSSVWLLATMLEDMRAREPDLIAFIQDRFTEMARFDGLVRDGAVVVFRARTP